MFESQLVQMPGPRDIILYWPGPGHFLLCKSPGAGHTFRCKSPGVPGGMVTSQIDTCISLGKNEKVNSLETPAMKSPQTAATHRDSNEVQAQKPTITHKNQEPQTITHNEEKFLSGRWSCNMKYV